MNIVRKYKVVVYCILLIFVTPIIVNFIVTTESPTWIKVSNQNDWIGFFGNFLGSLLGALVAFLIFKVSYDLAKMKDLEDRRFQVMPFFQVSLYRYNRRMKEEDLKFIGNDDIHVGIPRNTVYYYFVNDENPNIWNIHNDDISGKYVEVLIEFHNIGSGIATDFGVETVNSIELAGRLEESMSSNLDGDGNFDMEIKQINIPSVQKGKSQFCFVAFEPTIQQLESDQFDCILDIRYLDIIGNLYSHKVELKCITELNDENGSKNNHYYTYIKTNGRPELLKES